MKKSVSKLIEAEQKLTGNKILFEYIRNRGPNKEKLGIIVAIGSGKIGWALCKKAGKVLIYREEFVSSDGLINVTETWERLAGDKFNFEIALGKACKRARAGGAEKYDLPFSLTTKYYEMAERSARYFKD